MKLIKLFFFLFLISSCNKYLGKVEPDYSPSKKIIEIFSSNINTIDLDTDIIFGNIKYPNSKLFIKNLDFYNLQKVATIDQNTIIFSNNNNIYFSVKNSLTKINKSDKRNKNKYKLDTDKDEIIIKIFEINDHIFLLTNKSKLFKLSEDSLKLEIDFETYSNSNPLLIGDKLIIFSVFGDALEINLSTYEIANKGKFSSQNGTSIISNSYVYNDHRSYLFNSGTLIFLNKFSNELNSTYYLDDLNILSSMNTFEQFLDAPFAFENYLYFLEKKGFLSVFNPITSEILWEIDVSSSIKDYLFSEKGYLALLTNNKIFILDKKGNLIFDFSHKIEEPISFLINTNEISIFNNSGLSIFDIKSKKQIDFIKTRFNHQLNFVNFKSDMFIKDSKSLYQLSE